ncbi:uncharacterized protein LOC135488586 [Lineus longissimus]|uniref:uncharacterized protein LOC135488586 n=1 Tax=Lineus longissimus TaxID=88925 RepID=UPI00315DC92C
MASSYAGAVAQQQQDGPYEAEVVDIIKRSLVSVDYRTNHDDGDIKQYMIVEALIENGIPIGSIKTVLKVGQGHFSVRFQKGDPQMNEVPAVLDINGVGFWLEKAADFEIKRFHTSRYVKVHNYPGECDIGWIRETLQKYGLVKAAKREMLREYNTVESGTVTVVMNVGAKVPKVIYVKGNRFRTWYRGQEDELRGDATCFRCRRKGHYRYECTEQLGDRADEKENEKEDDVEGRVRSVVQRVEQGEKVEDSEKELGEESESSAAGRCEEMGESVEDGEKENSDETGKEAARDGEWRGVVKARRRGEQSVWDTPTEVANRLKEAKDSVEESMDDELRDLSKPLSIDLDSPTNVNVILKGFAGSRPTTPDGDAERLVGTVKRGNDRVEKSPEDLTNKAQNKQNNKKPNLGVPSRTRRTSPGAASCTKCSRGKQCPSKTRESSCGRGMFSAGGKQYCDMCDIGTYVNEEHTECKDCPPGSYCPSPDRKPLPCPPGFISEAKATVCIRCQANQLPNSEKNKCIPCGAGKHCLDLSKGPVDCPDGYYSKEGESSCRACPAGHHCKSKTTTEKCSPGTYAESGWRECLPCPAGFKCSGQGTSSPQICDRGQYSEKGATSCKDCPPGKFCINPSEEPKSCEKGTYSKGKLDTCLPCPAGMSCPSRNSVEECKDGSYSFIREEECSPCPKGSTCANKADVPQPCPSGQYNVESDSKACKLCPAGSMCPKADQAPKSCPQGAISSPGQTNCTMCPAGYKCPNPKEFQKMSACAQGTYSMAGQSDCTECPLKKYCPYTDQAISNDCPPGTYSEGKQMVCTQCKPGKACPQTDGTGIVACKKGEYSLPGAVKCQICPTGYACPSSTNGEIKRCPSGTFAEAKQTKCTPCPPGKMCPNTKKDEQMPCPDGTYSVGKQASCTLCPPGFECPEVTGKDKKVCQPGFYSLGGKKKCEECSEGSYCPSTVSVPYGCPAGMYSEAGKSNCTACEAGFKCPTAKASEKTECPKGFYSRSYALLCKACERGYICEKRSNSSRPVDGICNKGGYCDGKKFHKCPKGTYNPFNGSRDIHDCIICPAGYVCYLKGMMRYDKRECKLGHYCPPGVNVTGGEGIACPSPNNCTECPAGHFCPSGTAKAPSTHPKPCKPGTYNPLNYTAHEFNCRKCDAGWACPDWGQPNVTEPCSEGHYCPNSTVNPTDYPCLPGTYTGQTNLTRADECDPCPQGKACFWGTGRHWNGSVPMDCAPGHYCPLMTPTPTSFPCPKGTYSAKIGLYKASQCTVCPAGKYCRAGLTHPTGSCPQGFFCPSGTKLPKQYGCPNGTYNDEEGIKAASDCKKCTKGHYCEYASIISAPCRQGSYMPHGMAADGKSSGRPAQRRFDCLPCVGGHWCGSATIIPKPCGLSMYSDTGWKKCKPCPQGFYCDLQATSEVVMKAEKQCTAGMYCGGGLKSMAKAVPCTKGKYCIKGTPVELNCPVGTIRPNPGGTGLQDCVPCPAGAYCLEGSWKISGRCNKGFYCPTNFSNPYHSGVDFIGSYGPRQVPCPPGTYTDQEGTRNVGEYLDHYLNCTWCDAGLYCDSPGLMSPRAPCDPGYVCRGGASTSAPVDGKTGDVCPRGGYCPLGSGKATPCPLGTYSNITGAINDFDCFECDPGYYCNKVAGGEPTGLCYGGYFCRGGAKTPTQNMSQPGYYAPNGSIHPRKCEEGTYNPYPAASECQACDEGAYCPERGLNQSRLCPMGKYCPLGSVTPINCPVGTYNNRTGMKLESECLPCPPGHYCSELGGAYPTGKCMAGHICYRRAVNAQPIFVQSDSDFLLDVWGEVCREGRFCPEGTDTMLPCPVGTYNPDKMGRSVDDCRPCDPGKYCDNTTLTAPSGICTAGFFCISGMTSPTPAESPMGGLCPLHHFCPNGTSLPKACPSGFHANSTGMRTCKPCPGGYLCYSRTRPELCPEGHYCPGSNLTSPLLLPMRCPMGRYSRRRGLEMKSQCKSCEPGSYCNQEGMTQVSGPISGGYWSSLGATFSHPPNSRTYGACPRGFYCPVSCEKPIPCPVGTYSSDLWLQSADQCLPCPGGKACPETNMTQPGTDCYAGYYCVRGSTDPAPGNNTMGGFCPSGSMCPTGSEYPTVCKAGTYQEAEGEPTCDDCPAGFYCLTNTSSPTPCPPGYYCPLGTIRDNQFPCDEGTFFNTTGASEKKDCKPCTPGYYCLVPGLATPTGPCKQGFYCSGGSEYSQPYRASRGGACKPGSYCPEASPFPIPCTPGWYCDQHMMSQPTGKCYHGFYCKMGASTPAPRDGSSGDICPRGHFCPVGSPNATACPAATYNQILGGRSLKDCLNCTKGYYCENEGNARPTGPCHTGYYCPSGVDQGNLTQFICPLGHRCPRGSSVALRCSPGSYQDEFGQGSCETCPAGYYCDTLEAVVAYNETSICPKGHYCPPGTRFAKEHRCPPGTYNDEEGAGSIAGCLPCSGGYFCDRYAQVKYTNSCLPGYYCRKGAKSGTPRQGGDANRCPRGFYCPLQTAEPQACPNGTFSNVRKLTDLRECQNCTHGHYCGKANLTSPEGKCLAGYYCPPGSILPDEIICPKGGYCPEGSSLPELCPRGPAGTFSNMTGLNSSNQCQPCVSGMYCLVDGLAKPSGPCKAGYYCPEGSIYQQQKDKTCMVGHQCPTGTGQPMQCQKNSFVNHTLSPWCYPCPLGHFCKVQGHTEQCPMGHYCPEGTGAEPIPCPPGTYGSLLKQSHQFKLKVELDFSSLSTDTTSQLGMALGMIVTCLAWMALRLVSSENDCGALEAIAGECGPGYWCLAGIAHKFPNMSHANGSCPDPGIGGICTIGYYCPGGLRSIKPLRCPSGTYSDEEGRVDCIDCPEGYYCPNGTGNFTANVCKPGHYCLKKTQHWNDYPCKAGTFNNQTGATSDKACTECPAGSYCSSSGLNTPSGECHGGFYCRRGTVSPTPDGHQCNKGTFCPPGSAEPVPCSPGHYCASSYLPQPTGMCDAGYFCKKGAQRPDPVDGTTGGVCPSGFYCQAGSGKPHPCPVGSYSNTTRNVNMTNCHPCLAGSYCKDEGSKVPTGSCSKGYYCPGGQNSSQPDGYNCTKGHYCSEGTIQPKRCPSGQYQDQVGAWACKVCPAGYYCDSTEGPLISHQDKICPRGFFCPNGTLYANMFPCPSGTFGNETGQTNVTGCHPCPATFYCGGQGLQEPTGYCDAGYICVSGANVSTASDGRTGYVCPMGQYCPRGSLAPYPCPKGTYSGTLRLRESKQCRACRGGHYCPIENMMTPGPLCLEGFFCSGGADNPKQNPCPKGSYCVNGTMHPTPCPVGTFSNQTHLTSHNQCRNCSAGSYCGYEGLTSPSGECWAGYYCPGGMKQPNPSSHVCPRGMQCPNGSAQYQPCEAGAYTSTAGKGSCSPCPPGFYCLPAVPSNSSRNILSCPVGYYCPQGTYNDQLRMYEVTQCKPCPGGTYCKDLHQSAPSGNCSSGHFCPNGTRYSTQFRCPPGSYNAQNGKSTLEDCLPCSVGVYCQGWGSIVPTGNCSAGWYCSGNASLTRDIRHGGKCPEGFFCPEGSSTPQSCPSGSYCHLPGQATPTGKCAAGYYCSLEAHQAQPTDGTTGNICPAGFYCLRGSSQPVPCESGTYNPTFGNMKKTDCLQCDAGEYCGEKNMTATSGNCTAGFYCPPGQSTASPFKCPVGHFCPEHSHTPILCPSGQYQEEEGRPGCDPCPAGYYCDNSHGVVNISKDVLCPAGYYCPTGTGRKNEYPCPLGTYSILTGLNASEDCTPCAGGHYCGVVGQVGPTGLCAAGYFCRQFAKTATPNQTDDAGICPQVVPQATFKGIFTGGTTHWIDVAIEKSDLLKVASDVPTSSHFCPEGTNLPQKCPPGTYSGIEGLKNDSECRLCSPGYFCARPGLISVQGPCEPGYYCTQASANASQIICPVGRYCPEGTAVPKSCPKGTFNPTEGLSNVTECLPCTSGMHCNKNGLSLPSGVCTSGFYCLPGQSWPTPELYICPLGHFCQTNSSEPILCPPGSFMNHTMAEKCYQCPPGWFCLNGTDVRPCPEGYYCPTGTGLAPQPCPRGRLSNETGLARADQCRPCPGGAYCNVTGATTISGKCFPGFYCSYGVDVPEPISGASNLTKTEVCWLEVFHTGVGDVCPIGHYCPGGSAYPRPCPAGSYGNETGLRECLECPAGYYCLLGSINYTTGPCPVGHYCLPGTTHPHQYPCPSGSYNPATMATSADDCLSCPPGLFCLTSGLREPSGKCSSGWYCTGNSSSAMSIIHGGECPSGYYCPEGASTPVPCDPGMFCQTAGLESPTGNCTEGFYCISQASISTPTDNTTGNVCPFGHVCPSGSTTPQPCPAGYYLNSSKHDELSDCILCTAGMYCPDQGMKRPERDCRQGYYCPPGQTVKDPEQFSCPLGHFCPVGSAQPQRCESGTYQNNTGQWDLVLLPLTSAFIHSFLQGLANPSQCQLCPGGKACPMSATVSPDQPCAPGHYCLRAAKTKAPVQGNSSFGYSPCPAGFFCPKGTGASPRPCPVGTYSSVEGLAQASQCLQCPAGKYCSALNLTAPDGDCAPGFYCTFGVNAEQPSGNATGVGGICPLGHKCPLGSAAPVVCEAGTFQDMEEQPTCKTCPPGYFCPMESKSYEKNVCQTGHYCPSGTQHPGQYWCEKGTFNNLTGSYCPEGSSWPMDCDPGMYCDREFLTTPRGPCDEGFYCVGNATSPRPQGVEGGRCRPGYYCPKRSASEQPCPAGYFQPSWMAEAVSWCISCTAGYYCNETALAAPTGLCDPGYYCPIGQTTSNPKQFICPPGYYCEKGSSIYQMCPYGTYQDETGQSSCKICPEGYYCDPGQRLLVRGDFYPCPAGHYCPNGTRTATEWACPVGTYNNVTGLSSADQCQLCTGGFYCPGGGIIQPSLPCSPGYYCRSGAKLATPRQGDDADLCPVGHYCPEKTVEPVPCPPSTYANRTGLRQEEDCWHCRGGEFCAVAGLTTPSGLCNPGFYCPESSVNASQKICPAGSYCPQGTHHPFPCPSGTWSNVSMLVARNDCLACLAGSFCRQPRLTSPQGSCHPGYFCPEGSDSPKQQPCPIGYFCPNGTGEPILCSSGSYSNQTRLDRCNICPEG